MTAGVLTYDAAIGQDEADPVLAATSLYRFFRAGDEGNPCAAGGLGDTARR